MIYFSEQFNEVTRPQRVSSLKLHSELYGRTEICLPAVAPNSPTVLDGFQFLPFFLAKKSGLLRSGRNLLLANLSTKGFSSAIQESYLCSQAMVKRVSILQTEKNKPKCAFLSVISTFPPPTIH